jgi:hypothetical protein
MESVTLKTQTIFVAFGRHTFVYKSLEDMPRDLKKKLVRKTTNSASATILIADRRGKEELLRAIQGAPKSIPLRVTEESRKKREYQDKLDRARARRYWLEIGLIGVIGVLLWTLAAWE